LLDLQASGGAARPKVAGNRLLENEGS
jgi:hypothetical protein